MFAVTNIDDLLVLAVLLGRATGAAAVRRVVAGQYLGFGALVAASVAGAFGAGLLPERAVPYLGVLPLAIGLRAGLATWRDHRRGVPADPGDDRDGSGDESGDGSGVGAGAGVAGGLGVLPVAAVTVANGGDNLGVYLPVFAVAGARATAVYVVVFLAGVAVWCAAARFLATRRPVARALSRWGHVVLPVVLVGLGVTILVEGGAFGL